MEFTCPICSQEMPRDLQIIAPHTEGHIVDEIKKTHPDWAQENGVCKKCYEHYKNQLHPK